MANFLMSNDADLAGSGYWTICHNLCSRLVARGHHPVVLGHEYNGQPHDFPFTIAPSSFQVMRSQVEFIKQQMWPDALVFSWDVPAQRQISEWFAHKGIAKYIGIFPIEAGPFKEIDEWVGYVRSMDHGFVISEFGLRECQEAGLDNVTFLPVGIDHEFFKPLSATDRADLRSELKLDGRFVVLTVADNHFRKNLSAGIQIMAEVLKELPNAYYLIIARPHPRSIGWSLKELAIRYGIQEHITIIHSRPSNDMLLRFYQASDVLLAPSHAEGLGLPILEAQACNVPVVAGDWTAMTELLDDGKGVLVGPEYTFIDPFGNQRRHFISIKEASEAILKLASDGDLRQRIQRRALAFTQTRTYDAATEIFVRTLEKVL